MLITEPYRTLNRTLHENRTRGYGGGGYKWAEAVMSLVRRTGARSILDYGCGEGTLKAALPADLLVVEYDPAVAGKDETPKAPVDVVVATDVLEHIEPGCLPDVLNHIHSLARRAVFLTVATRPSNKQLPDDSNAHRIVQGRAWWWPRLQRHWPTLVPQSERRAGEFVVIGFPGPVHAA